MQCITFMILLYMGLVKGRTEEDQATASGVNGEIKMSFRPSERCFYQLSSECPKVENFNDCPCKRIRIISHSASEENAVFCCNLNSRTFDTGLACASKFIAMIYIIIFSG